MDQFAAVVDDLVLGHLLVGDLVHLPFEGGGHLGGGHVRHVLFEGFVHGDAGRGRFRRMVPHVAPVVELLDDVRPGRLGAEPLLVHQLDQLRLGEPGRRLGFLVDQPRRTLDRQLLSFLQGGDLLVGGAGIGVDAGVSRVEHDLAAHEVGLGTGLYVGPGALGHHRLAEGGEEAADDQLVDPRLRAFQGARVERVGRVDRRVGGVELLALGRMERLLEDRRRGGEVLDLDQRADRLLQRQRVRVDRVVGSRVGDETVVVQVLGQVHRALRRDPESARGVDLEGVRVVRGRRLARGLAAGHRLDHARADRALERRVGLGLVPELVGGVMGLEAVAGGMLELGEELPEWLGDMGSTLELPLDDQAEGRALDPPDREEGGAVGLGDQRDRPGEGGAPDQVDVLTGTGCVGQRVGELVEVGEGAFDLFLGQGRVTRPFKCGFQVRVDVEANLERFEADQLAFAVEVGADHQAVSLLRFLLDRLDHVLLAVDRAGLERRVDQAGDQVKLPLLVLLLLRELAPDEVAAGADHGGFAIGILPAENRNGERLLLSRSAVREDLRDLLG